jgi:hypothetical protein
MRCRSYERRDKMKDGLFRASKNTRNRAWGEGEALEPLGMLVG